MGGRDGIPGEIVLVFGGFVFLFLYGITVDFLNYIDRKTHEGGKRHKMKYFKFKGIKRSSNELGESVIKYIESLRKENRALKKANSILTNDNCELVETVTELKNDYEVLNEENKFLHLSIKEALEVNGKLKRQGKSIYSNKVMLGGDDK